MMTIPNPVLMIILFTSLVTGCATNEAMESLQTPIVQTPAMTPYVIRPGDELDIKFFYNPELNETVTVRPDGKISLQLIDEKQAAGLTPGKLDELLSEEYARELKMPVLTVIVRSFSAQRIYVGGEVNRQGLINLPHGMTILQAVFEAGGLKDTARPEETMVIRKGPDNQPIPLRLDLAAAFYGKGNGTDFLLQPADIVYVPKSPIAKANQFVNQYIERLLLFRGVSFGFTYEINDFKW